MARVRYLLPCSCGRNHVVGPAQAGQELRCSCGQVLEVPTMQALRKLERATQQRRPARGGPKWGVRHRLVLVGFLVTSFGLGLAAYFYSIRPSPVSLDLPPYDMWVIWQEFRQGLHGRLDWERSYEESRDWNRRWLTAAGALAGIGVLTMLSALMVPKERPRRPAGRSGRRGPPQG